MNDMETFKELMHGMAEAKSPPELWIKQARFMRWCGDNPDKLANLIVSPAEPASLGAEAILDLIPTNWCDPLLTGPNAALGTGNAPWGCPEIEALLNGLRERIRKHLQHQPIKDEK